MKMEIHVLFKNGLNFGKKWVFNVWNLSNNYFAKSKIKLPFIFLFMSSNSTGVLETELLTVWEYKWEYDWE